MKHRTSRLVSILLALCLALALLPGTALAADGPEKSINFSRQAYSVGYHASTVTSYLYENEDGGLTRVEYNYDNGKIVAEKYDSSFQYLSGQRIPVELDIWGGFFAGETCNFFVFGRKNKEEDDNKEVIRVVKYSKDWQRLGQASLCGANTTIPFDAGSLRFAEYDGMLYIRTSHELYKSSDGKNHQKYLALAVRESDMTVTDSAHDLINGGAGYVSHSFNQFILVDREQRIVALDHGDAYPRAAVLYVFAAKAGAEKITRGEAKAVTIQRFPGSIGDNTTGASLGGLAETSGGYVAAYTYDGAGKSNTAADRSAYFAYVDKESLRVTTKAISDVGATTPVLAPTGTDGGYILWNACASDGYTPTDTLYYARYSADGSVGEVKTATADLSDCRPIVYNGKVVWYTTNYSSPTFYQLDDSGVTAVETDTPTDISVTVNGRDVTWTYAKPFIDENGRTMVPLSALSAYLYFGYGWDAEKRVATFSDWGGRKVISFTIGDSVARTAGGGTIQMDTAAVIRDDRTYAPARYLAEYFGYTVSWDAATRTVIITG